MCRVIHLQNIYHNVKFDGSSLSSLRNTKGWAKGPPPVLQGSRSVTENPRFCVTDFVTDERMLHSKPILLFNMDKRTLHSKFKGPTCSKILGILQIEIAE